MGSGSPSVLDAADEPTSAPRSGSLQGASHTAGTLMFELMHDTSEAQGVHVGMHGSCFDLSAGVHT